MRYSSLFFFTFFILTNTAGQISNPVTPNQKEFHRWAVTPPMGWNSWDCYGPTVTESEVKANADYMAEHLKRFGWEYIVVDIRWYVGNDKAHGYNEINPDYSVDEFGRFMPAVNRFPSSANGKGFKPLADYVHDKGLKFGIHIMRGIPKIAVEKDLPVLNSDATACDIYSERMLCRWLGDMYTIEKEKDGAQEYYNSLFSLYASWGVDFIKVDDLSSPYHTGEIEMIRKAIDSCGRKVVFSTSPGETPIHNALHVQQHANMWRIVGDFWDNWPQLKEHFEVCRRWAPFISPGAWPDADMLPLGHIGIRAERGDDRMSRLTHDEQHTLITLFVIFRSPLMFGGNLPDNDAFTLSLLTNKEILAVSQSSTNNRELFSGNGLIAWAADDPQTGDKFLALFNTVDREELYKEKALWSSGVITKQTPGQQVSVEFNITGAEKLYLAVDNAGDNNDWDHADWIDPILVNETDTFRLTSMPWKKATAGWGEVSINKSVSGGDLIVNNKRRENGIGTHSNSVIEYDIPQGYKKFKATAGLDNACVVQHTGATVEFMAFTQDPAGPVPDDSATITVQLQQLGLDGECIIKDLWTGENLGIFSHTFSRAIRRHASGLYRISKK
ncbi:MAG: NPCBM/NEW2 domain-containing protein [Bacteroidales bacterium]|nr:NPCBM/NEW2 domain-containing protein [Bacteroidales bacterium]